MNTRKEVGQLEQNTVKLFHILSFLKRNEKKAKRVKLKYKAPLVNSVSWYDRLYRG